MSKLRPDVEAEIAAAIRKEAAPIVVVDVKVRVGEDWEGDEAIFVDVWYDLFPQPVAPMKIVLVHEAVALVLRAHDDQRFPYVSQHFADTQRLAAVA